MSTGSELQGNRYGKDIEDHTGRGLRYHVKDRVLVCGNKTIMFR